MSALSQMIVNKASLTEIGLGIWDWLPVATDWFLTFETRKDGGSLIPQVPNTQAQASAYY